MVDEQAQDDLELFGRRRTPRDPDEALLETRIKGEKLPQTLIGGQVVQDGVEYPGPFNAGILPTDSMNQSRRTE